MKKQTFHRPKSKVAKSSARSDSWTSVISGLGTFKDKRQHSRFQAGTTDWVENMELWRGDDLAGRIVETHANEMFREGWELSVEGEDGQKIQKKVTNFLEDLGVDEKLWLGLCFEQAYGGGGVVIGANDGQDMSKPLDLEKVSKLNFIETFEPRELQAAKWQRNPELPGFGKPKTYFLYPSSKGGSTRSGFEIHESRILIFPGIVVSRQQVTAQAGWGDAALSRSRDTLRDFQTAWGAAGLLVADFAQAIWKIKGLSEIIAMDKDAEIHKRIQMMEYARSTVRAVVIDADGEEFERKQTPVQGLPDLLDRFATRLAASADIPVALLMGMSPAGLNATGNFDIRTFYDRVKARQNKRLKPALEKLCRIAFAALRIKEPDNWSIEFRPLWQPTDKEVAETMNTQANTDEKYQLMGVLAPKEIREQRFGGRRWNMNTRVAPFEETPEVTQEYKDLAASVSTPSAPAATEIQKQALNGAQIASLVSVVAQVNLKQISRESGQAILELAFQLPSADAARIIGPEFTPVMTEPNASTATAT